MIYLKRITSIDKRVCHGEALSLLGHALSEEYDLKPDILISKSPSGKPFLENHPHIHFNISHCPGMLACAVGDGELGVDLEALRPVHSKALKRAFTAQEQSFVKDGGEEEFDFFRLWTLKESFVKAVGTGLAFGLKNVEFDFDERNILSQKEGFVFRQYLVNDSHLLAVCNLGAASPTIVTERLHVNEHICAIK